MVRNSGGGQPFEQVNIERTILRNFEVPNIKRMKDELFDFFNFEFFLFSYLFKLFEHLKYTIIHKIANLWNFNSFVNCKILKILYLSKWYNFRNLMISEIVKFGTFLEFFEFGVFRNSKIENFWNFPHRQCLEFS